MNSDKSLLSNKFVQCYSDRLVIDLYYFPFGDKTIRYRDIQSCQLLSMHDLDAFKYKIWGMALSPIWWHSDIHRFTRQYYILLDTNQWPKIGLTMNDDEIMNVYKFIQEKIQAQRAIEKKSFDQHEGNNMSTSVSEKELEYRKSLEGNQKGHTH